MFILQRIKFVEQNEHSECGLACVTMILNYFNYTKTTLQQLRDQYGVPMGGYKLSDLVIILKENNLSSRGFRVSAVDLFRTTLPVIAFWNNKHYVVIEKRRRNNFLICDPSYGKRWMKRNEVQAKFSNVILGSFSSQANEPKNVVEKKSNKLVTTVLKYKKDIFLLLGITLLLQLVAATLPLMMQFVIDSARITDQRNDLMYVGFISIVCVFYYFLQVVRGFMITWFHKKFDWEMMSQYIYNLIHLPVTFFSNRSNGEIIFRSNLNVYIRQILSHRLVVIVVDSVFLIVYLAVMLYYSVTLTLLVLLFTSIIICSSLINGYKLNKLTGLEVVEQSKLQKNITEMVKGIETIKTNHAERFFFDKWQKDFKNQLEITARKGCWSAWFGSTMQVAQFSLPLFIIVTGMHYVSVGVFSIGMLISFNSIAQSFVVPVSSLSAAYNDFLILKTYFSKVSEVLDYAVERTYEQMEFLDFERIEIKDLSFQFSRFDHDILSNVNFSVKKGEKIAIVGHSGSGKSTLLKLIGGMMKPTNGSIRFIDLNGKPHTAQEIKAHISFVTQQPAVFNESISTNITLKAPVSTSCYNRLLEGAIIDSGVSDMINQLPLGVETLISEDGANLSGGQKQRIAFARLLFRNTEINLFDEPTSSLDPISENEVMSSMYKSDNTCIVAAHRLKTIKNMDKIIVLNRGKVTEIGTHDDLIKNKQTYYNLYKNIK